MTRHSIHTRWIFRTTLALALVFGPFTAACEPTQVTCLVDMSPQRLGIIVHDGKVSGMVTVGCNAPVTRIDVSANLTRDRGNGVFHEVAARDFDTVEPDGNYVLSAPCIPGRWRFSYSVLVTAAGESKRAFDTSDVTEVHPDDC